MSSEFDKQRPAHLSETEFEASLASGSQTPPVSPQPAPAPRHQDFTLQLPSWAGKVLGHFKLLRRLGEGQMGMVIQAQDINLQRIVALKVINKRLPALDDNQRVLQFLREARAAAQIEHPNVVRIYEISQHKGWWYIAMEMIEGGNLRSLVKAAGPLPVPKACSLIADAADALAAAHSLGIIHRDIKPTNLMLTRQGRCKLTDFGLVRIDDPNDPFDFTDKAVGSPQFMAPEMISHRNVTSAVDVYGLANALWYALVGEAPYTGLKVEDILNKHLYTPVPDIRSVLPDCPPSLAALIMRAMSKEPSERPTASQFAVALRGETVGYQADESGTFGSSSRLVVPHPASAEHESARLFIVSPRFLLITAVLVGLLAGTFGVTTLLIKARHSSLAPARLFPNAPATYGILPPLALPQMVEPAISDNPPLAWAARPVTAEARFVASKSGKYFFPLGSPMAMLIRADSLVTYKSAADAVRDGRLPGPP
jgi:eukaryotic-like serine/threonine-protein kinase